VNHLPLIEQFHCQVIASFGDPNTQTPEIRMTAFFNFKRVDSHLMNFLDYYHA
jgi:hypothetical protein